MGEIIKLLPSGISNFEVIRKNNRYYVDKTQYIAELEGTDNYLFYGRPRRFGKSLFVNTLAAYYDVKNKDRFDELFSGLWIHDHPTKDWAKYQVLVLDFSKVSGDVDNVEAKFNEYCCLQLFAFAMKYEDMYYKGFADDVKKLKDADGCLNMITTFAAQFGHPLYLIVDEYDNFTNTILSLHGESVYRAITHGEGFYRELFKKFKGTFERIFLTGVSPVTLDDLTSGFNIASYVSQKPELNRMLGFSEIDVKEMIKYYHTVGMIKGDLQQQTDFIISTIKPWCDNYYFSMSSFVNGEPPMYNGMMVMYYLKCYMSEGEFPYDMTAPNTMIDYGKLDHLIKLEQLKNNDMRGSIVRKAVEEKYVLGVVKEHFPARYLVEDENFISLMYYYGMLTITGRMGALAKLTIPNNNIRKQYYKYILENFCTVVRIDNNELAICFANAAILGNWHEMFAYIADMFKENSSNRNADEKVIHGFYMCCFSSDPYHLLCPEMELNHGYCDIFLMPDKRLSDVKHSFIIEYKYVKTDSKDDEITTKLAEAKAQLKVYSAAEQIKNMTIGTTLHCIAIVFKGFDMVKIEEV